MRNQSAARAIYAQPGDPMRSPRSIEYDLLARNTQRLRQSWEQREQNFAGLATAILENTRLWRTLASDVAQPENQLPQALRAQLFYLYQFIEQRSRKVLAGKTDVGVLAEINTAVMRGLRGQPGPDR